MNIKRILAKGGLAVAVVLASAVPALPSTITINLNFTSFSAAGINYTTGTGNSVTGVGLTAGGVNEVGVGALELSGLTLTDVSGTWTLKGELDNAGTASTTTLLTFTNTPTYTANATVANYGATTTLTSGTVFGALASALGISATGDTLSITGGSLNNLSQTASDGYNGTVGSPTLTLQLTGALATPEPASFLLFGTGLLIVGLVAKNRRAVVKPLI